MKKHVWLTFVIALVLTVGSIAAVHAEILPPHGEGQIGLQAVVLCEELALCEEPSDSSTVTERLEYGDWPIVIEQADGWAYCVLGDSEDSPSGWVNADYIVIDPAWYRTDAKTPVYAWNDTAAPKVALLDADTSLPILKEVGEWSVVSLRGAAGWIYIGGDK